MEKFVCKKCGRTYKTDNRWCEKCGGRIRKKKVWTKTLKETIFDNSILPELADKLGITHSELLEWNDKDPDGLDKHIREEIL